MKIKMPAGGGYAFGGKNKIIIIASLAVLAVGCNFSRPAGGGLVKTVNGGADWLFSNGAKGANSVNLSALNISKMALNPGNREEVYAAGYNGGLYKSSDSAESWNRILSKIFVYDFALSSQDSKTVYAAGLYGTSGKALKTTDSGKSWQEIYSEASLNNTARTVALDQSHPGRLMIGTDSGTVIKSADSGLSWQLAWGFKDRVQRIIWQNGQFYVLLKNKGLFRSGDFGSSFENLTESLMRRIKLGEIKIKTGLNQVFNQFFIDSISSDLIYLTTGGGLFKTTDSGKNWAAITMPVKSSDAGVRGISVAQTSSNIVFAGVGSTVFKSTDGGASWQTQSIATTGFINYILIDPELPQIVYAGIYIASQ